MVDFDARHAELQEKYREAVYRESCVREAAFLDITMNICGVSVYQFSPFHYILLDFVKSPFISGQELIDEGRITEFLWVVSVDFKTMDEDSRKKFIIEKMVNINYDTAIKEIVEYLEDSFLDIPATSQTTQQGKQQKNNVPYYAWVCSYIDTLCHEYSWDDEKVIHMPFARIFQYIKAIETRHWFAAGKEPQLFNNLSDRVVNEIIALHKEQKEHSHG